VTLANDLAFQDILEGDLSYRETTEFLIARERTMERKLAELGRGATVIDRGLSSISPPRSARISSSLNASWN